MKRLPFVKTLALFILIAALTITFVGCASKELTDVPPADVAAAIIAATGRDQDTLSNSSEYFEGDKFLEYIASRYGITLTSADNAAVFGADYTYMKRPQRQTKQSYLESVPKHELEALARCLLPNIQAYFESEEGKREYAEWEAAQEHD